MVEIKGRYVYDDDDLTPGNSKEGGLHQNLYKDGQLKANARFIPDEEKAEQPDPEKVKSPRTDSAERSESRRTDSAGRSKSRRSGSEKRQERAGRQAQRGEEKRQERGGRQAQRGEEKHKRPDPEVIYETVYIYETSDVHDEEYERKLAREREEAERKREQQAEIVADVVRLLIAATAPHVKRFWQEKGRPFVEARRAKKAARSAEKSAATQPIVVEATVVDSNHELAAAEKVYRANMSSAEAQARYLAALAARAFSDEQMRLVFNANIVDGEGLGELQRTLAELPPQQVIGIIEAVAADPSALDGELSAELGKLLGQWRVQPDAIPVRKRKGR